MRDTGAESSVLATLVSGQGVGALSADGRAVEATRAPASPVSDVVPAQQQDSAASGERVAAEAASAQGDSEASGEGSDTEAASAQGGSEASGEGGAAEGEVEQVRFFVVYKGATYGVIFPISGHACFTGGN